MFARCSTQIWTDVYDPCAFCPHKLKHDKIPKLNIHTEEVQIMMHSGSLRSMSADLAWGENNLLCVCAS